MKKILLIVPLIMLFSITLVKAQDVKTLTSNEVYKILQKNKQIVILDVRTPGEFSQGHLKNAINIDVHRPDALDEINKLDKNKQYLVYCRTKNRSGAVVNAMVRDGFKDLYQMTDGITGWNMNQLPLEK